MKQAMALLGKKVHDKVSGAEGIVESISFDLYGCVQAVVRPPADDKGVIPDGRYFDVKRLEVVDARPVMAVPSFADEIGPEQGPAEKPARAEQVRR